MDRDPRAQRVPAASPIVSGIQPQTFREPTVGQTAARQVYEKFGIPVRPNITRPLASTTASDVLVGDAKRVGWLVVNRGTTDVNLDMGARAVAGQGVLLAAGGGWASAEVEEDGEAVTYNVSVVAASGTPQLWVYEVLAI